MGEKWYREEVGNAELQEEGLDVWRFTALAAAARPTHFLGCVNTGLSSEAIESLTQELVEYVRLVLDGVAGVDGTRTWANTMQPLVDADQVLSWRRAPVLVARDLACNVDFPRFVSSDADARETSTAAAKRLSQLRVDSLGRRDVFDAVLMFSSTPAAAQLQGEEKLFVENLLQDFRLHGTHLERDTRGRLGELQARMDELSVKFEHNLVEDNTTLEFTAAQLKGVPASTVALYPKTDDNSYLVSLKYPHSAPLMRKCEVAESRRRMEVARNSICLEENVAILEELLRLRHEKATLLGFPTFAHYLLRQRMAGSPDTVVAFLNDLSDKLASLSHQELHELRELKKEMEGEGGEDAIQAHDLAFYLDLRRQRCYGVDTEVIREYFPWQHVLEATIGLYSRLLQVDIVETSDSSPFKPWHDQVRSFRVNDADGREMGHFLLDLWPRKGKYDHFGCFSLQSGSMTRDHRGEAVRQPAISAMLGNFTPPPADGSAPCLLRHSEVVTFFHEMGHVMHDMCSSLGIRTADRSGLNGTPLDFLEAPSQMLENWCWSPSTLRLLSRHHTTGKPLDDDLIDRLCKSRVANAGLVHQRQVAFSLVDQVLHSGPEWNTGEEYARLCTRLVGVPPLPGTNFLSHFQHLSGGYAASYYGYLYSDVFAADMFATRFATDPTSVDEGRRYRRCILESAGLRDVRQCLEEFIGRAPNMEAFLRQLGVDQCNS